MSRSDRRSPYVRSLLAPLRQRGAPDRPWSRVRLAILGAWTYAAVFSLWKFAWSPAGRSGDIGSDLFFLLAFLGPAVGSWVSSREASGRASVAWRALAVNYALLFLSGVVWLIGDVYPSIASTKVSWGVDLLTFTAYFPLVFGLLRFPVAPQTRAERVRLLLDAGTVVLGTALATWYGVLRHGVTDSPLAVLISMIVWGDVLVIVTVVVLIMRRPAPAVRFALAYIGLGHVIGACVGLATALRNSSGATTPPPPLFDVAWMASAALIFIGTMRGGRGQSSAEAPVREPRLALALPYLSVLGGLALLLLVTYEHWDSAEGVVLGVNAVLLLLVVTRQALARRDALRLEGDREVQEARFRSLVQHGSDVITVVDRDGVVRYHSPAFERVFGYDPEAWVGRRASELLHREDAEASRRLLEHAGDQPGTPVVATMRLRHRLGSWVPVEVVAVDMLDDPAVAGVVLNARDVSERVRLESELRQSQKLEAVGRLAGGIAHDFNNLLAVIRGNAGLILGATEAGDACHDDAAEIELAAERAAALTRQLLAFSKRQIVAPQVVDLNTVARTTERLFRRALPANVEYHAELREGLWSVHADPGQLEQVVMNLVLNARDAMPSGGVVRVRTANERVDAERARRLTGLLPGEYATLTVADTGAGMDDQVRAHLFEPFFTTKTEGTGLGLSTVFGIVTAAGGHVSVESAPGTGARFVVYLPRHLANAPDSRPDAPQAAPAGGRETILVVDDEESVRTTIGRILQRRGYVVLTAEHGADALERAAAHPGDVHLLLTDLSMPVMDGRALMQAFRARWPATPIVCMSGYSDDATLRAELSSRADSFLAKPFPVDSLAQIVRTALDEAAD